MPNTTYTNTTTLAWRQGSREARGLVANEAEVQQRLHRHKIRQENKQLQWDIPHSSPALHKCDRLLRECNANSKLKVVSHLLVCLTRSRCHPLIECSALHCNKGLINNRLASLPLNRWRLHLVHHSHPKVSNLQIWTNCACLLINKDNRNEKIESSLQPC